MIPILLIFLLVGCTVRPPCVDVQAPTASERLYRCVEADG